MPRGDGTGPMGRGPRGRRGGGLGAGLGGVCVCPNCGKTLPHQRAVPCNQVKCPNCGSPMARQEQ